MRRGVALLLLALLVLAAGACAGRTGASGGERAYFIRANLHSTRFTLSNGLDVVLHPDASFRSVTVNVRYDVGSRHDPPSSTGLAHFVEHLTFRSKPDGTHDLSALLARVGAVTHNATTTTDATEYYATVASSQLPLALFIEAARMARPLDGVDEQGALAERSVVRNERRERFSDVAYGELVLRAVHLLFEGDAYGTPTAGFAHDDERLSLSNAKRFVSAHYRPNNATLVIAGAFEPVSTAALVRELFGEIPAARVPRSRMLPPPSSQKNVDRTMATGVDAPAVALAWLIPPAGARGWHEMELATDLVAELTREELGEPARIHAEVVSMEEASVFLVHAELQPKARPQAFIGAVERAVAILVDRRLGALLGNEKTRVIAQRTLELESIEGRAHVLQSFVARYDRADSIQTELHAISDVRYDEFASALARYLQQGRRVTVVAVPTRGAPKAGDWGEPWSL
ncbi:MAG: insulinase family protein [Labilithrix sp.]|nr:insulinase family protein [Labilithrix sp.]MBX3222510.1 insulinase family protein [Labilithrix sp.]